MGDYLGLIVGGALIAIAVLRLMYGRLSSPQSQWEEFATYLALLFFVISFSLTIIRSPEGVARYKDDIAHSVPYIGKISIMTPDALVSQLSHQRILKQHTSDCLTAGWFRLHGLAFTKGMQTTSDCMTCHAVKREAITGLAASIVADSAKLNKSFDETLIPLQRTAASHGRTIALLPKESPTSRTWRWLPGWLTAEGRATRALEKRAARITYEKQGIEEKLSAIRGYYGVNDYRLQTGQHLNHYAEALQRQDLTRAGYHLLLAGAQNISFQMALEKGNDQRNKAAWTLFIINWGCLLYVVIALGSRALLRRLNPDAAWYIYPGFILFGGISLILMSDIGLNYVPSLRFLGVNQWYRFTICYFTICFATFATFVIVVLLSHLPRTRNVLNTLFECIRHSSLTKTLLMFALMLLAGIAGWFIPAWKVVSSQLITAMAVIFLAWYATVRGDYLSRRSELENSPKGWARNHIIDLLLVSIAPLCAFRTIHDFGPLLSVILLFSCYVWILMGHKMLIWLVSCWSAVIAIAWIFREYFGKNDTVAHIYRRIYEMLAPFSDGSTELAKLAWLRKSAGAFGYKFGRIEYYGHYVKIGSETKVTPLQIQSDYTASHVYTQFGYIFGLLILGVLFIWLLKLFLDAAALAGDASKPASGRFWGWVLTLGLLQMIIQMFLTVGGNFLIIPLTGVTLPFISYGFSALFLPLIICAISYAKERLQ